MHGSQVRRCAEALSVRLLPIVPGDVLTFMASGNRIFIVAASQQEHVSGGPGQSICGLMSERTTRSTRWCDFFLDWNGFKDLWTIGRLPL